MYFESLAQLPIEEHLAFSRKTHLCRIILYLKSEQAYKPSSVLNNHLSRCIVTDAFKQPTIPGKQRAAAFLCQFWSCSEWGLHRHVLLPARR